MGSEKKERDEEKLNNNKILHNKYLIDRKISEKEEERKYREEKALLDNKLSRYVCKSQFSRLMDYFWFCLF